MTNLFEERNFIQPMGSAIMLSRCFGFFTFKFWVSGWKVGGEVFFSKLYLVWRVHCPVSTGHWTFYASFIQGSGGGREGRIYFPFSQ